jgi:hypothetical protein
MPARDDARERPGVGMPVERPGVGSPDTLGFAGVAIEEEEERNAKELVEFAGVVGATVADAGWMWHDGFFWRVQV